VDEDQAKRQGQVDEVKGRVQEAWGDLTGDQDRRVQGEKTESEGKAEQVVGDLRQAVDDATS
jgi:uncharacterized protein YjbJ (UPF0337 family)